MNDQAVSLHPYFKIKPGCESSFRDMCDQMVAQTSDEKGCINYGFSFSGQMVFCRESYVNAEAALIHLKNIERLLNQALELADMFRLEIHGNAEQLEILKDIVEPFDPELFTLEKGFRN